MPALLEDGKVKDFKHLGFDKSGRTIIQVEGEAEPRIEEGQLYRRFQQIDQKTRGTLELRERLAPYKIDREEARSKDASAELASVGRGIGVKAPADGHGPPAKIPLTLVDQERWNGARCVFPGCAEEVKSIINKSRVYPYTVPRIKYGLKGAYSLSEVKIVFQGFHPGERGKR